ncbi:hypothetical protein QR680_018050 [Steinernema hermaphroditum]|uniref:VWFA domain-containing protein n=1 Tax=Steinernema hermaphroditum TaxID=289476 RepID=A0AA39LQ75_9BILA|nr:hypothetical protein QR680_018050 [Steinernema hermaphroditum]
MLRLVLLVGFLAIAQADDCTVLSNNFTSTYCSGYSFYSPTSTGFPDGAECLANQTYTYAPTCSQTAPAVTGYYFQAFKCPANDSDGYLLFESDFGSVTIEASECVKSKKFVGSGKALNFYLVQGEKYFNFMAALSTAAYTPPTTTTVVTTPAIPTKGTVPPSSNAAKFDILIAIDEIHNTDTSLEAIKKIVTSFVDLVNPVITADPFSYIRISTIFLGPIPFSIGTWQTSKATFVNLVNAFIISSDDNSASSVGPADYTGIPQFIDTCFGSKNSRVRDHTTRALLIFTSNDTASESTWAPNFITNAQKYDVHTIVVPVDSDVTNIQDQLKTLNGSTKPLFYDRINSTTDYSDSDASAVAEDLFNNYLLDGKKLCNVECSAPGTVYKFPNVDKPFNGSNYCANTNLFRCSMKELFKNSGCDLNEEVTVTLNEYDIDTGLDTLNFYEVFEIESFSGFKVKNTQFHANLSEAYFVFNSVPSSVFGDPYPDHIHSSSRLCSLQRLSLLDRGGDHLDYLTCTVGVWISRTRRPWAHRDNLFLWSSLKRLYASPKLLRVMISGFYANQRVLSLVAVSGESIWTKILA